MRLNEDLDKEYNLEIEKEYLQLLKDVFDMVPRILDGKLRLLLGFVNRDDFFGTCMADIQVQAILDEKAFEYMDERTGSKVTETIRQALYRLSAEMKKTICWLDVVKFLSSPQYQV